MNVLADNKGQLIEMLEILNQQRREILNSSDEFKIKHLTNPTADELILQKFAATLREYDNTIKYLTKVIQIYGQWERLQKTDKQ